MLQRYRGELTVLDTRGSNGARAGHGDADDYAPAGDSESDARSDRRPSAQDHDDIPF